MGVLEILIALIVISAGVGWYWYRKPREAPGLNRDPVLRAAPTEPNYSSPLQKPSSSKGQIFLSYSSSDRVTAQALAGRLSEVGWSVWWDRSIPPGKSFDEVIEDALNSAKCIVVLWSRQSVASDWVKTEASEGARRGILVPAFIERVTAPLEFRRIQAADLTGWDSASTHPGFESLARSVAELIQVQ